jgi:hypothetical protein
MTRSPIKHGTRRRLARMNTGTFLATTFVAIAMLATPFRANAMSVRQYESETTKQRGADAAKAIDKIIDDVAKVDPALSRAIHDYFYAIPSGKPESPGLTAFEGGLLAVDNLAAQGKLDLDKVQIEGILLDLIKTDVMPKVRPQEQ